MPLASQPRHKTVWLPLRSLHCLPSPSSGHTPLSRFPDDTARQLSPAMSHLWDIMTLISGALRFHMRFQTPRTCGPRRLAWRQWLIPRMDREVACSVCCREFQYRENRIRERCLNTSPHSSQLRVSYTFLTNYILSMYGNMLRPGLVPL